MCAYWTQRWSLKPGAARNLTSDDLLTLAAPARALLRTALAPEYGVIERLETVFLDRDELMRVHWR